MLAEASTSGKAMGADDFTPLLIYATIKAQPPQLAANIAFIERFRSHVRLTGEAQYYFVQLSGAAAFIETVDATSLKCDPGEQPYYVTFSWHFASAASPVTNYRCFCGAIQRVMLFVHSLQTIQPIP